MTEFAHDPNTGDIFWRAPGNQWVQVDREDVEVIKESGTEAFLRQLGDTLAAPLRGAAMIGSPQGLETQREALAETAKDAQVRSIAHPGAHAGGTIAGYVPDIALGAVTGGATLARRVGTTALVEGTLGALRTPNDPVRGAAIQGGIGAAFPVAGAAIAPLKPIAQRVVNRISEFGSSVSERMTRTATGEVVDEADRALKGLLTPDEARRMNIPLTRGDAAALSARSGDEFDAASALRQREELARSSGVGSIGNAIDLLDNIDNIRTAQGDVFTKRIVTELGGLEDGALTRQRRAELREGVGKRFDDVYEHVPDGMIPLIKASDDISVEQDFKDVIASVSANNQNAVQDMLKKLQANNVNGAMSVNHFKAMRDDLSKKINTAFNTRNHELGSALSQMNESLDRALQNTLPETVAENLAEARKQWRIVKALERANAVDPSGQVSPRSFRRAYEAVTPSFKRAARYGDELFTDFERLIDTMEFLQRRVIPSSGTAERLMYQSRVPGGVAAAWGAHQVFGN